MDALDVVRVLAGFVYVLFVPGYAASWALFPKRSDFSDLDRIALSVGLSIPLSTLPVMLLNYVGVPVDVLNVFLIILSVIIVCALAALSRSRLSGGIPE